MRLRALIFIGVLGLLNVFVAAGVIHRWPGAQEHLFAAWAMAALFFVLQLTGMIGERTFFHHIRARQLITTINWASYLAFGILSSLCVYVLAADAIAITSMLVNSYFVPDAHYNAMALSVIGVLLAVGVVNGVYLARKGPKIISVDVPLKNLPRAFDGFRIVQISDLHAGPTIGKTYVDNVVRMAQGLHPDLVALTGDFADGHVDVLAPVIASLGTLKAPYGLYYIPGNHEYYWGASQWFAHFQYLGAQVLLNQHRVITKDGAQLVIAGVTDLSAGDSSPAKAAYGAPADALKILLAHQPNSYKDAEAAGFSLQLSGHTHNGQYFPFTLMIRLFQRYAKGLNRFRDLYIYVNRGTGYWGPPLRTFNAPEITLLTLRCA